MRLSRRSLFIFLIIYLIIVLPESGISISQSNIGVEEGDAFTYVVDKYSTSQEFDEGYYLGYDDLTQMQTYAIKGDKFTITIGALILREQNLSDIERMVYEVNFGDKILDESVNFDHNYGRIITSIDWDYQKQNQQRGVWSMDTLGVPFILNEWELIDTPSEFGMRIEYSSNRENNVYVINAEIKYQKDTGMLSLESVFIKYTGDLTLKTEYIVKLIGDEDQELILPGFEWKAILAIFPLIIIRKFKPLNQR